MYKTIDQALEESEQRRIADERKLEWHKSFLRIAKEFATKSNCVSRQVGVVITRNKRVISTGYNGTPSGWKNCNHVNCKDTPRSEHHAFSEKYEIHAEINAIVEASKNGSLAGDNLTLYSTLEPCDNCLKVLVAFGITEVYFQNKYDLNSGRSDNEFINNGRIKCTQIEDIA